MRRRVDCLRDSHQRACSGARRIHTLVILLLLGMLPAAAWSAEGRAYLDANGGYKSGDFGTPTESHLYYFSPALGYASPSYEVSITIPYLFTTTISAGQTATEEGIGDIILRGGLVLVETNNGYSLSGALAVKFGTADENKGLGTGETDYGGFLGLRKKIGQNRLTLSAGYIKVGSPAGVDLNDGYVYDIGYARIFARTELSVWYEGRRALVPGARNPREINIGFFHILGGDYTNYTIKGSSFAGLNNGGPDFGINLGVVRWF